MTSRPPLLFIGDRFPLPIDCGAKIRTTQVLRGMKTGAFDVRYVCPATEAERRTYGDQLGEFAPSVGHWAARKRNALFKLTRLRHIVAKEPISVLSDAVESGRKLIVDELARRPAVAVVDFLHTCVLTPQKLDVPSVLFTHNVEAEIFKRHRDVSTNGVLRRLWDDQYKKMKQFERDALGRFDAVVAVSDRDRAYFEGEYGARNVQVIPTGVDLDHYRVMPIAENRKVAFLGSMDWLPNIDAIQFFATEVWPAIRSGLSDASMKVIGRNPPASLRASTEAYGSAWEFTGFVDDVRTHVEECAALVIPLRIGGGTRLKVYEAMAMGRPIISTAIGVEGLPVTPGEHYLEADTPAEFGKAVTAVLRDKALAQRLATNARNLVEERASYTVAARAFEDICQSVRS